MDSQRALFGIPDDVAYLNCAYLSPLTERVREAGRSAVDGKARPWKITPPDFFTDSERARKAFAALVNGDADGVAITASVSYGIALAARNLPLARAKNVLVLEEQFPSNVYEWRAAAAAAGGAVVTVPRPGDDDWTAAILQRIDGSVGIVALPNCHWTDGTLIDLVRVGEAARAVGASLVVDVIQSLGARPFDVEAVRPDWVVCACHKWLLGPFSLGLCWVAPQWRDGEPIERNWITRAGAEDFTALALYTDGFAPGARRYDMGGRSNFANVAMAVTAMEEILGWGVEQIEAYVGELTDEVAAGAEALGWQVAPRERRARHMLGLRREGGVPEGLPQRLKDANVHVSVRGSSIRVSPHVYNSRADVARLLEVLEGA
ncbi:MAG TPA: aminotransferase class V-fold PLP-dependent enzyme [Actinomycetota bacterium]|nr:aminotransferase class V-fold PLP-dependent enzyme [Actinomycetota bacterium]